MGKVEVRLIKIFDSIKDKNTISIKKVIKRMKTEHYSESTIRRDLNRLATKGLIILKYNLIEIIGEDFEKQRTLENLISNVDEKKYLSNKVYKLLMENDVIFVSSCTTNEILINSLQKPIKMIITNGDNVFRKVIKNNFIFHKMIIGGFFSGTTCSNIGIFAEEQIKNLFFDKAIIGFDQIDETGTVYIDDYSEAHFLKKIIANSKTTILVGDYSKYNIKGLYEIGKIDNFDFLVQDYKSAQLLKDSIYYQTTIL